MPMNETDLAKEIYDILFPLFQSGQIADSAASPAVTAAKSVEDQFKQLATQIGDSVAKAVIAHIIKNADIALDNTNLTPPNWQVPPGIAVVGVGGGIPGPMTGATTTPGIVSPPTITIQNIPKQPWIK